MEGYGRLEIGDPCATCVIVQKLKELDHNVVQENLYFFSFLNPGSYFEDYISRVGFFL